MQPREFLSPFLKLVREPEVSGPITGVALTSLWRLLSSGILGKLLWNVVCWVFATAVAFAAPITDALMLPGQASSADGHTTAAAGLACQCTRMDASSMEHLAGAGPACVVVHALPVACVPGVPLTLPPVCTLLQA